MHLNKLIIGAAALCTLACCKKDDDDTQDLNATDRSFMTSASYANNAEVDAGNAASTMGMNAEVRMFGTMMVSDHTTAQNELRMIASETGVANLPTTPDSMHIQMKAMLMTLSGRKFDSAYINMQVMDHQNTISLMQNEISNGSHPRVKAYASAKLPVVQHHKHVVDSIKTVNAY